MTQKKIALITGANKGISYETARQLGREGMHVILAAREGAETSVYLATLAEDGPTGPFFDGREVQPW